MPVYAYTCATCGIFRRNRPMAEAGPRADCVHCGRPARRVYEAPAMRAMSGGLRAALDAQHRSADSPEITTSVPPRTGPSQRRSTDPRHARLPRP